MNIINFISFLALGLVGLGLGSEHATREPFVMNVQQQQLAVFVRGVGKSQLFSSEPLIILLSNRGATPIYLLDLFEVEGMPYSLELSLRDSCGQQVFHYVPHVKVELAGPLRYVALEPGETLSLPLDLPAVAHAVLPGKLPGGKYTLTVTYFNRLGQRCFQGSIASEPVELTVTE